jgi:3-hydroxyisobutyrate dehydrogenase-like beta-hydroxyacid dehydrogenase
MGGANTTLGFIGLGVMGEPMCRHLATKSGLAAVAYDLSPAPLERLQAHGVEAAASPEAVAERADLVFLALPSGEALRAVCSEGGLLAQARAGQTIVDLGTSPVDLTRELARSFAAKGADYADAPVARTREAAERGALSVMVGGTEETFARIEPLLRCFAAEVTHCGAIGAGQVVKQLNNMVLFETVVALAEALAVGRRAGVDPVLLFETLTKGSADSFALRNHGMKAMLPGVFPERAFSAEYALKDLTYALDLAGQVGVRPAGAEVARRLLERTVEQGLGDLYFPVLARIVDAPERSAPEAE